VRLAPLVTLQVLPGRESSIYDKIAAMVIFSDVNTGTVFNDIIKPVAYRTEKLLQLSKYI